MQKFARLIVETKGAKIEDCKQKLVQIQKNTKNISAIRELIQTSATKSPNLKLAIMRSNQPDFLVEVKINKNTNLQKIIQEIKKMSWDVQTIIPY
ncbi:MAG: hypothetical protein HRO68_01390 [Nitrosopumilus sp.]|nr:hypothetical protein [Nitrosopumilus sp.]